MTVNIEWELYGTEQERETSLGHVRDAVIEKIMAGWYAPEIVEYYNGDLSRGSVQKLRSLVRNKKLRKKKEKKLYHFYVLQCPVTGQFRYVGVTNNPKKRLRNHCSRGKKNPGMTQWFRWLAKQKLKPRIVVLESQYIEWPEPIEEDWIQKFCRKGHPILNINGCKLW